jgi:hypothetical protein
MIDPEDTTGSQVLVQASGQDNNLHPVEGSHRDSASRKLHTFKTLSTHDLEEAAVFFEGLAADYDGQGIREGAINGDSGVLNGVRAYNLWANRFARATGMPLREPRLDHVFWGGLPSYIFTTPRPRVELKKGDDITLAKAAELVKGGHVLRVLKPATPPYTQKDEEVRLGFMSGDQVCAFGRKERRRGYPLRATVKAAHAYDSWENQPGIEHAQEVISTVTQGDPDPTGFYVSGVSDGKHCYLELRGGKQMFSWSKSAQTYNYLAGFKDQADAERAIEVLNKVIPDTGAKIATVADLPAGYFKDGKNPALAVAPAVLPEIPNVPKVALTEVADTTLQAHLGI